MAHHCFLESLELGHSFVWFVSLSFQTVPMLLWPQIYFFWWGALGVWKCEGTDLEPDSSATQWESKTQRSQVDLSQFHFHITLWNTVTMTL